MLLDEMEARKIPIIRKTARRQHKQQMPQRQREKIVLPEIPMRMEILAIQELPEAQEVPVIPATRAVEQTRPDQRKSRKP